MLYFAYGSNMDTRQLRKGLNNPNIENRTIAYLPDSVLIFPRKSVDWGGGVASYASLKGHKLFGVIFEVSENELQTLDSYEGCNRPGKLNSYERVKVTVYDANSTRLTAVSYKAVELGRFLPSAAYMKILVKGARDCGLPVDYLKELEERATEAVEHG